ncbi:tyrosine-type recombinase/integrase [Flavobacterium sp. NG2]|uniref:tyrosine-type recombinase/integrase n=1 Tax=Flavobacterium sp. NG2 TaxID=3097547 RepID=UPI002A828768|nr:tyrosine-type recombinase/integrase [Flavobacterium sp. NG2]WPR72861.1 tyrosine-type recombinase/integrase [Flavobacterium sp. NG2]
MATIIDFFKDYLLKEKNYSVHTVAAYESDLLSFQSFNMSNFEQESIVFVNYSQIRTWIVFLVDEGLSSSSVNRKMASLKAFYRFLLKTKQITVNPMLKHKSLKASKVLQIPFSEKEVVSVLDRIENVDGFELVRNKMIIDLLYATGMRRAELINLKVADVDFSNNTIKVLGKRSKERIVPMLSVVKEGLLSYSQQRADLAEIFDDEFLFLTKKGVKLSNSFVYRLINSYFSTASEKVKKSPHVLRHTFATHLLNNGADLNSVKELLGHSSLASTQVYTHSSLSELKKVYEKSHPRNKK